ncbi:MAG: hypothetical protein ACTSYB_18070 [Candidatus Helarchaeota archaeon]
MKREKDSPEEEPKKSLLTEKEWEELIFFTFPCGIDEYIRKYHPDLLLEGMEDNSRKDDMK